MIGETSSNLRVDESRQGSVVVRLHMFKNPKEDDIPCRVDTECCSPTVERADVCRSSKVAKSQEPEKHNKSEEAPKHTLWDRS